MKRLHISSIFFTDLLLSSANAETLAPDGTYVGGDSAELAPDGTHVGGKPELAPDGTLCRGIEI